MDLETAPAERPRASAASLMEPEHATMRNMTQCCSVKGSFSSCGSAAMVTAGATPLPEPPPAAIEPAHRHLNSRFVPLSGGDASAQRVQEHPPHRAILFRQRTLSCTFRKEHLEGGGRERGEEGGTEGQDSEIKFFNQEM